MPRPRDRQPVAGGLLVLPVVRGVEPCPDHRGQCAAYRPGGGGMTEQHRIPDTEEFVRADGFDVPVVAGNTVVVGAGSAGYCAAERLAGFGQEDTVVIADKINAGASRNAGSDKQTYYKLTLSGDKGDLVREMARTLFSGGAM